MSIVNIVVGEWAGEFVNTLKTGLNGAAGMLNATTNWTTSDVLKYDYGIAHFTGRICADEKKGGYVHGVRGGSKKISHKRWGSGFDIRMFSASAKAK